MDELQNIYDRWSEETEVEPDVKAIGGEILEQRYRHCGDKPEKEFPLM